MSRFHVWRGGLSGRYFAGRATEQPDGTFAADGVKHDVTEDIQRILHAWEDDDPAPPFLAGTA